MMPSAFGPSAYNFAENSRDGLISSRYYSDYSLDDSSVVLTHEGCAHRIFRTTGERFSRGWRVVKETAIEAYEMGRSDPRKAVFAAKMGAALSLVSLLMFFKEPPNIFTHKSIWAILTVVVVFEFSIGATLSKGFNRGLGTLTAGALALGIAQLSMMVGEVEEVIIVVSIFIAGFAASYLKLHPAMKQYEYGFRVFLLTFCIVLVSEDSELVQTAVSRLLQIAVGAVVCLMMNVCVLPIWAGQDLHKLIVKNFKEVAMSLEGCVKMYLQSAEYTRIPSKILVYQASDDPLYKGYRAAVESTSQEETLLGFAIWEPPHGRYKMFNYPWSEYVKVGGALRHCAFMVMAMHGCILSEIQAPSELRVVFKDGIQRVGTEGAKVLLLLSEKVEKMEKLDPGDLLQEVHDAAEDLQTMIDRKSYLLVNAESWENENLPEKSSRRDNLHELNNDNKQLLTKSLSASFNPNPTRILQNSGLHNANQRTSLSLSEWGTREDVFEHLVVWPSRLSLTYDATLNEREARTYESASALSLATFTSLLIEYVARLQNLVNSFEELSDKAKFREPVESNATQSNSNVGFWNRLSKCVCSRG
ncbi:aluminum-activated malate transporter 4-like [Andrographis paniculata]|uniref:aluminum-activated malate transporter 4-like n=1 Tax=Andrographis paniculata TaxID=175694 RepID=UPI0021E7B432|nr:aluminum-activated malate transporter 4-like [Andrographis paniculata]XP_051122998.1 aluminum-activated malate transporter 4-like [Andrographis paniculata]XP_051122999.1 aluminum-activated malate transporter 4-like [Andrographis paniculata]